ncbi:hypothetical protein LCGC14_2310390 [marine sediment metagenome]|uniref:Terminase large subunit-like ATPase domain-containing protein n=1 Tax=marine sediment metagenome TaxID=412755 RepID=A0A0F9EY70_9ZZZZ
MTPTAKANRYVRNVLSGKVDACKWVKLACERWQNDHKRAEEGWLYQYNAKKADKFCLFVEKMPHIKGKWAKNKEKIRLEDWQCFIYCNVFGWYSVKTGERRFRVVYTEVPRKNAKSTMSAPVAMNLGFMDNEPGAEVYTTATKREQARIVFNIARRMAQREAGWRKKFNVEVGKHAIFNDLTDSKMEPLSADYSSLDGLNIYAAVVDELHAHKNRELFEVIETGTGATQLTNDIPSLGIMQFDLSTDEYVAFYDVDNATDGTAHTCQIGRGLFGSSAQTGTDGAAVRILGNITVALNKGANSINSTGSASPGLSKNSSEDIIVFTGWDCRVVQHNTPIDIGQGVVEQTFLIKPAHLAPWSMDAIEKGYLATS